MLKSTGTANAARKFPGATRNCRGERVVGSTRSGESSHVGARGAGREHVTCTRGVCCSTGAAVVVTSTCAGLLALPLLEPDCSHTGCSSPLGHAGRGGLLLRLVIDVLTWLPVLLLELALLESHLGVLFSGAGRSAAVVAAAAAAV